MIPELWIVGGVVAAAAAYLGWVAWRTIAGTRKGCGSGCGKCPTPSNIATSRSPNVSPSRSVQANGNSGSCSAQRTQVGTAMRGKTFASPFIIATRPACAAR